MHPSAADTQRAQSFAALTGPYDVLILGGGATGLGLAVDAATRGYRTALVEAGDFAQATSSRSTKLVHGGVRYLASGQVHLVREALHERAVMLRNAPHLVRPLPTLLPAMHLWELPWYGAGLSLYDLLSGKSTMGPTRLLSRKAAAARIPGLAAARFQGGVLYHDAQFNDARFALALALTALDHGATVVNYARATQLLETGGKLTGAIVRDEETGAETQVSARCIVNATGIFTDEVRTLDEPTRPPLLSVSRGSHIVVPARFLGGDAAIMVPKTEDGRVIFAIPWQGVVLVGTTDLPDARSAMEPSTTADEIDYLLAHIAPYLAEPIQRTDILSIFSGLRPLVTGKENKTSKLSREHHIDVSGSGLITVAGGKWTTYRRMAQDTLDFAAKQGLLPAKPCRTDSIPLHAAPPTLAEQEPHLAEYGTDAAAIAAIIREDPTQAGRIDLALSDIPGRLDLALPYTLAMVTFAVRHELARTVEDVLSRRTRALLLDARAALRAAPAVAALMARELGRDDSWQQAQLSHFQALAHTHYLP